jgi:PPOX class probable F420-dependent enzyme
LVRVMGRTSSGSKVICMAKRGSKELPAGLSDILEKKVFGVAATLGPDGEPQCNPVWIHWEDGVLKFSNTKARQKYKNVKRDPRIAICLMDPDNPYRYLEIRGRVVSIEDDPDNAFIDFLAKKYRGLDRYPSTDPTEERVVITVQPEWYTFNNPS